MELLWELAFMLYVWSIYFLYLELVMHFVLWTYALCICVYLIFEVGMNL